MLARNEPACNKLDKKRNKTLNYERKATRFLFYKKVFFGPRTEIFISFFMISDQNFLNTFLAKIPSSDVLRMCITIQCKVLFEQLKN